MILAAMAVIGLIDNYVVLIAKTTGLWQFHATRTAMALVMFLVLSGMGLGRLWPLRPAGVLGRSLFFSGSMLIYFGCLAFLPISQVVAGLFTSPIFVMVISALVLKKPVGPVRWTAAVMGFIGIVLVLGPAAGSFQPVSLLPLLAALLYAISAVATRQWCEGEDTLTLLFWFFAVLGFFGLIGTVVLTIYPQVAPPGPEGFILRGLTWPDQSFLFWTFVQAAGSILGVGLLTRGYQIGEASHVAIFEYSLMLFAAFWAWALWGQTVSGAGFAGMALIVASGAVIAIRSR